MVVRYIMLLANTQTNDKGTIMKVNDILETEETMKKIADAKAKLDVIKDRMNTPAEPRRRRRMRRANRRGNGGQGVNIKTAGNM